MSIARDTPNGNREPIHSYALPGVSDNILFAPLNRQLAERQYSAFMPPPFAVKMTESHSFLARKGGFCRAAGMAALMAFCLLAPYARAATLIATGQTETIPGTQSSPWTASGSLAIDGTMNIHSNGSVSSSEGLISYTSGSSGTVTVDGAASIWSNSGRLVIGFNGAASLAISNGARVSNADGYVGYGTAAPSTVTVDGAGAAWVNTGTLYAGYFSDGSLVISNGGTLSSTTGYVGTYAGSLGAVTVDGAASSWVNTGGLSIGYSGAGVLTISNGATVSSSAGWLGVSANGSGTLRVDGAASTWSSAGDLYIGHSGSGTLAIGNGATVSNLDGVIGTYTGGSGTVTVDGAGSTWSNTDDLYIGLSGTGTLAVSNGATVSNQYGAIGTDTGGSGTVTVDGTGSTWSNTADLYIGYLGTGALAVSNGATVSSLDGVVGVYASGSGTVTVDGAASTWSSAGDLYIGYLGTGALAVDNDGLVSATNDVIVAVNPGSTGTLDVSSGGVLEAGALKAGDGSAAVTFDGGTLRATADNQAFITGFGSTGFIIAGGGLIIDDNGYAIATDSSVLSGTGGLIKTGAGTLTLGGASTYSGPTSVASGTLKAGAADVFSQVSVFSIAAGATLDLDGYDQSVASLTNSGALRIGSATSTSPVGATLSVSGAYESNGGSLYLRTILYDDSSLSDKLIADSVTTGSGGATRLYITNVGGAGAYTTSDGIPIVQVATTSDSSAFVLGAPVTAGIYEYVLTQGADQSWYLTNVMGGGGAAVQRTTLYNPNIGSYLGNQYAAATMFNQSILDRRNSVRSTERTVWVRTHYNSIKSDLLGDRQKVTVKTVLLQAGVDLVNENGFVAGIYAGYGHSAINNRSRQTGTRADGRVDGYHIGAYVSWIPEEDRGPYVDLWTYHALYDNELSGPAQSVGKTGYDSSGYALSGEVGYGFELHGPADGRLWILEPHLQLTYVTIDADNVTDSNGTRYTDNRNRGYQTRAGARFYGQQASGRISVNPFIELNWLHNHVDNGMRLDGTYISSNIARNAGEVKIGLQGQAMPGLNLWGHVGAQRGSNSFEHYEVQLGLAWQW